MQNLSKRRSHGFQLSATAKTAAKTQSYEESRSCNKKMEPAKRVLDLIKSWAVGLLHLREVLTDFKADDLGPHSVAQPTSRTKVYVKQPSALLLAMQHGQRQPKFRTI